MRRALVVDDDRTMVETIGDILTLKGWQATGVHSAEEAISAVDRAAFDCVIMDVKMGGIDGLNALHRIRDGHPGLPVVLMTAYTAHELIAEAERQGALYRIQDVRNVTGIGNQIADRVHDGRAAAFVTARSGAHEAMESVLVARDCPMIYCDSAADVADMLRDEPRAILWRHQLPTVPAGGAVVVCERSPGALLVLYGVDDYGPSESTHVAARFGCGYLRKPFPIERLFTTIHDLTATA